MYSYFQNLFVDPSDKSPLVYEGGMLDGKWDNGILKSGSAKWDVERGMPLFSADDAGDAFTKEMVDGWINKGIYKNNWDKPKDMIKNQDFKMVNQYYYEIAAMNLPILDIASGPGLGFIPALLAINPDLHTLASDTSTVVLKGWQKYFKINNVTPNVSFAEFDVTQMPLKSESIDIVTSAIGLSSIRYYDDMYKHTLAGTNEVFRVLKHGGYFYAIEGGIEKEGLDELGKITGRQLYLKEDYDLTWDERFKKAGFLVKDEINVNRRLLTQDDNDIGRLAYEKNIKVYVTFNIFKLFKD